MARFDVVVSLSSLAPSSRNSLLVILRVASNALLPAALVCAMLSPPAYAQGVAPTESTNGEVSTDTLNIHLTIPIVRKSGIGLPLAAALNYNSNAWQPGAGAWSYNANWLGQSGFWTSGFGPGTLLSQTVNCAAPGHPYVGGTQYTVYIDGAGNSHTINVLPLRYPTSGLCLYSSKSAIVGDGSGLTYNLQAPGTGTASNVVFPSGVVDTLNGSMHDVSGNTLSSTGGPSLFATGVVTDTLGVAEITVSNTSSATTYTYPTATGTASIVVSYTGYTVQTDFGCSNINEFGPETGVNFPTSIDLPDGSSYSLTYESQVSGTITGRIASVTYPTGELVSYAYTGPNNGINCTDGSAAGLTKTVTGDAVYQYTRNASTWLTTTLVNDYGSGHSNNTAVYTFTNASLGYGYPYILTQKVVNQGASTPLVTEVYCYNNVLTGCTTANTTLPITQTDVYSTIAGMSTSSRVSKTFDKYMNTTKSAVYDFGASSPSRQSVAGPYGYTWNGSTTSPTCTTAIGSGVTNKPCQVQLENGSGTQLRNTYLQYGTTTYPGSLLSQAALTGGSTYLTTSTTYNTNGTLATSFDANGHETIYTQGACNSGFVTKIVPPISTLDTQYTWDSGCNGARMMSATDPNDLSVSATYNDPFWRPTSGTDQLNNTVDFIYGYSPLTVEAQMTFGSSDFDAFGTADALGRPLYSQRIETSCSAPR